MNAKRIATDAMLTAIALSIFIIELQIPSIVPIPGIKLGLANIITVFAIFRVGKKDTALILFLRILLGAIFSGNTLAIMYSLAGGFLCYLSMILISKLLTEKQIFVCSIIGAISHNIGQIIIAYFISESASIFYYLPVLMISAVITGTFTGLCAQFVCNRTKSILSKL